MAQNDEEQLKRKVHGGLANVIEEIVKQPAVQRVILKQSLKTGFTLSAVILGGMEILNYVKAAYDSPWIGLVIGASLLGVGSLYLTYDYLNPKSRDSST